MHGQPSTAIRCGHGLGGLVSCSSPRAIHHSQALCRVAACVNATGASFQMMRGNAPPYYSGCIDIFHDGISRISPRPFSRAFFPGAPLWVYSEFQVMLRRLLRLSSPNRSYTPLHPFLRIGSDVSVRNRDDVLALTTIVSYEHEKISL